MCEPQYGDGNIVEVHQLGTADAPEVIVRDVPLEAVYPPVAVEKNVRNYVAQQEQLVAKLAESGMYN